VRVTRSETRNEASVQARDAAHVADPGDKRGPDVARASLAAFGAQLRVLKITSTDVHRRGSTFRFGATTH
jgi:hypothetical protein